ncbi:uncharacterized protein LOC132166536 [Corylus avellana]|uniref:uncharacterized protein LOC132166536 n=1 Tax=Corylus avellana TaxID=13451 RepID=UPI00286A61D1|nr:uncharacterized protein LOC132166536 [Corylus avellana]
MPGPGQLASSYILEASPHKNPEHPSTLRFAGVAKRQSRWTRPPTTAPRTGSRLKFGEYYLRQRQSNNFKMSFFSTPRKFPRKAGMQTPSPAEFPIPQANVKWEQEHEDILVHILCNCQDERVRPPFGKHVVGIMNKLNKRLKDGTAYTQKQVEAKIKHLKEQWVNFSELVRDKAGTGCGWDDDLGTVTGTPEQWEHLRLIKSLNKYYKFRNGPPVNFKHLCYIFEGSTSTGKWRYASTQSPLGSDCEDNDIHLNNLVAIIDLTEPQCASTHKAKGKGKGKLKREGSHLQGLHSSKRSSMGEQIYSEMHKSFDILRSDYLQRCKLSDGHSPGDGMSYKPPPS